MVVEVTGDGMGGDEEGLRQALAEREMQLAETQRVAGVGSWSWDVGSGDVTWTDEMYRIFGVAHLAFAPTYDAVLELIRSDHRRRIDDLIRSSLARADDFEGQCPIQPPDAAQRWVRLRGSLVTDAEGLPVAVRGTVQRLSALPAGGPVDGQCAAPHAHGELEQTPIPAARALFDSRASRVLARAGRYAWATALMLINLDDFPAINERLGRASGDEVLGEVARRLEAVFRVHDSVGRLTGTVDTLGADTFAVLCEHIDSASTARALAERVRSTLLPPLECLPEQVSVTASIGVAIVSAGSQRVEELFARAKQAQRRAKVRGPGQCELADDETMVPITDEAEPLRRALDQGEFRLVYQPKVDLATDRVDATEALLRWHDPERGVVPPLEFIPLAERTGMIVPIGAWVIEEACRQTASWNAARPAEPPLINR